MGCEGRYSTGIPREENKKGCPAGRALSGSCLKRPFPETRATYPLRIPSMAVINKTSRRFKFKEMFI
jgi:hypothetical protein